MPTFTMKSKKNIIFTLRQREYTHACNLRANLNVLRALVCQDDAKYKKIWEKHSNHPITYEGGKLYFENYKVCYTTYGRNGLPTVLYRLPPCPASERIDDSLTVHNAIDHLPLEHKGYRPGFLALKANNWLYRYDMDTGQLLQKVYLSAKCKFRHLTWDTDGYTVTLRSTHSKMSAVHRQAGVVPGFLMVLCTFTVYPLEFDGMMELSKEVFGQDIMDSMIAQGLLLVMHQGGTIRFYSWRHILREYKMFDAPLHVLNEDTGTVIGSYPAGLPINVKVTETPPVLLQVRCAEHHLTLGGIPWHYIISPYGTHGYFHVYTLATQQMAENGLLELETISVEPDKCFFHADDSGRILHIGADEVRLLRIKQSLRDPSKYSVSLDFTIKAAELKKKSTSGTNEDKVIITSSGRAVKRTFSYSDDIDCSYETIQTVDYENELDLLSVTAIHQGEDGFKGTVYYLNNFTGKVLKEIELEEQWKEFYDHTVAIDLDTIVHIVKGPMRKFNCYVHRLDRTPEDEISNITKSKTKRHKARHRQELEERLNEFSPGRRRVAGSRRRR